MGRVKDLWVSETPARDADGKVRRDDNGHVIITKKKTSKHPDNSGNKDAKRWQAEWTDPDGKVKTRVFAKKAAAAAHWKRMEADAERGEYIDPDAGKEKFGPLSRKALRLRKLGARSRDLYESNLVHHIDPAFAHRAVRSIKPSEVAEWLQGPLIAPFSVSLQEAAFFLLRSTFDLAVADKLRRDNPARSDIVPVPQPGERKPREVWDTATVWKVIDGHPDRYRALAVCEAGLGLREGCAYGLAEDDIDFEAMKVYVRRQVARHKGKLYFKLPKHGRERTIPLSRDVGLALKAKHGEVPTGRGHAPLAQREGRDHRRPGDGAALVRVDRAEDRRDGNQRPRLYAISVVPGTVRRRPYPASRTGQAASPPIQERGPRHRAAHAPPLLRDAARRRRGVDGRADGVHGAQPQGPGNHHRGVRPCDRQDVPDGPPRGRQGHVQAARRLAEL